MLTVNFNYNDLFLFSRQICLFFSLVSRSLATTLIHVVFVGFNDRTNFFLNGLFLLRFYSMLRTCFDSTFVFLFITNDASEMILHSIRSKIQFLFRSVIIRFNYKYLRNFQCGNKMSFSFPIQILRCAQRVFLSLLLILLLSVAASVSFATEK